MRFALSYYPKAYLCLIICIFSCILSSSSPKPSITLLVLGDVMLGRSIAEEHQTKYSWKVALQWLDPYIQKADLMLINLESPIALQQNSISLGKIDLRAPKAALNSFPKDKTVLLSIANNHITDEGVSGALHTERNIIKAGFFPIGLSHQPLLMSYNGMRMAFFAWDDVLKPIDTIDATNQIRQARSNGYWVLVSVHWGIEYSLGVTNRQKQLAQAFADAGANFIWGHHPHVLQPLDCIYGKNQDVPIIVAYSMGNTLFDQMTPPYAKIGSGLLMTINQNSITDVQLIPFEIRPQQGRVSAPAPESALKAFEQITYFMHHHPQACTIPLNIKTNLMQ